ncbi:tyrosine-type recombinase/integrase [Streptomyces virginiae]|uniref:tyrosine-type recombinase/integrase n=1 Tax=Streptomyces virginiae TaxID=1961 RepID=UPI0037B7262B
MGKAWIDDRSKWKEYPAEVERWKAGGKRTAEPKRWQVRYVDPAGMTKSAGRFKTKPEAEKARDKTASEINGGTYRDPKLGGELFPAVCADWLTTKLGITEGTRENYQDVITQYVTPYWETVPVRSIDWDAVSDWVKHLSKLPGRKSQFLSRGRIDTIYRVASMAGKYAARRSLIPSNPFTDHELPRKVDGGEHVYLSHEEVERLAQAAGELRLMIYIAAYTGPRFGEITALTVKRVDIERAEIRVVEAWSKIKSGYVIKETKNFERRTLPVPSFLMDELSAHVKGKSPDDLLFSSGGERLTRSAFTSQWNAAVKGAGLTGKGLTPHKLRHTAASLAIAAGANVKDIQTMLGHKSAALTLDTYGHRWPEGLRTVASRMDVARRAALA